MILAKLEGSKMGHSERRFEDAVLVARVQAGGLDRSCLEKWTRELSDEWIPKERLPNLFRRLFEEGKG